MRFWLGSHYLTLSSLDPSSTPSATMASPLDLYEPLDIIGNGSFGIIRKVRRKADGVVSVSRSSYCDLADLSDLQVAGRYWHAKNLTLNV